MGHRIPFNRPYFTGRETAYIEQAVKWGKLSGNGKFTHMCQKFFQDRYGFGPCFLTNSCTDALEMIALLLDIQEGDEVIMPTYTFVSTANAFVLRGAKPVFVDSRADHPGMDESEVEALISPRTKAIVAVHYAGVACDMDILMDLAGKYGLYVVEDAAQAIDGYYKSRPLGSIGHLAAFSFHETKNIHCGEGGMLVVNHPGFAERAEVLWKKGTNRAAFSRKEVDHYHWVDIGSSFLPSEITAAILFAQLEKLDFIQQGRKKIWEDYKLGFASTFSKGRIETVYEKTAFGKETLLDKIIGSVPKGASIRVGFVPFYASNNAHMFYLVFGDTASRTAFISKLSAQGILAIFHYLPLHQSPYYRKRYEEKVFTQAEHFASCLVRLPMYFGLEIN